MAIEGFSLAGICNGIKTYIHKHAFNNSASISVSIGAPGLIKDINKKSLLNLFFYRFEPFGFDADVKNNETLFLKTYCLITAFGTKVKDVEAGENELDLISKVIRLFHEHPVELLPVDTSPKVQVQFIFRPLQDEQINQIWSTQSNMTYQPSLLYEMALIPVPPTKPVPQPAERVRHLGVAAMPDVDDKKKAYPGGKAFRTPAITHPVSVNTGRPDWTPAICLVYDDACLTSLSIKVDNPKDKIDNLKIWLIGDKNDKDSKYSLVGAMLKQANAQSEAEWIVISFTGLKITPQGITIDPDAISNTKLPALELDELDYSPEINKSWQLQLFVERQYTKSDNTVKTIRSNPVLITLWQEE